MAKQGWAGRWPSGVRIAGLLLIFVLLLASLVLARWPVAGVDTTAAKLLYGLRTPWLDQAMITLSALGDGTQRTAVTILIVGYLLIRRRWRWALGLALAMIGAAIATPACKALFHVARPTRLYSGVESFSFPSGHATSAAALYLVLAWMSARALPRAWRPLPWALGAAMILLTAVSRVYVGAHWPTDVVAGMALGAALASLAITLAASGKASRLDGPAFLAALILVAVVQGPTAVAKAERLYAPYLHRSAG